MSKTVSVLFVAALVAVLTPASFAQFCLFGDDGFDTGCCAPPVANLPAFPGLTTTANYGVLEGCNNTVNMLANVTFTPPQFVTCDIALINVFATFNTYTISGLLVAKYTRTWVDTNPVTFNQVWRFLVNGDLSCQSSPPLGICTTLLPRCSALVPGVPVHWDGQIDYVCDPTATGGFNVVFSLHHLQGCISHAPWSCVPLGTPVDHPEMSYHLVGPAPFTYAPVVEPQGPLVADSVRSTLVRFVPTFQYQCFSEMKVLNAVGSGFLQTQFDGAALCGSFNTCTSTPIFSTFPGCYQHQFLSGDSCCNGNLMPFQSVPIGGTPIAATGLVALRVGTYGPNTFNTYPSLTSLTAYFGVVSYADQCGVANAPIHAVVGVGSGNTFGQVFNSSPPNPCPPTASFAGSFIDLQNVLPLNNLPFLFPGYGCLAVPDVVWSFGT